MSDNVVELGTVTRLKLPPERILSKAIEADLEDVVVIGWTKDGEFYGASSPADGGEVLWLLELCKQKLFEAAEAWRDGAA